MVFIKFIDLVKSINLKLLIQSITYVMLKWKVLFIFTIEKKIEWKIFSRSLHKH